MNKGWECPKCGAVMAPWVEECGNCKPVATPVYPQPWQPVQPWAPTTAPYKITCGSPPVKQPTCI